ncbi:uncharacterized protein LOC141859303 [Acropora palmata]|uniref:uncharacterized protein LOC141859303 n=1 Tax=Acropora palmata TaxID=6131 RepID=UPI003DA0D7AA
MHQLAFLLLTFGALNSALSEECKRALGMQSRAIADGQITASSQYSSRHGPARARLNYKGQPGAWSSKRGDKNAWLQIDLRTQVLQVTRIATQGRRDVHQWVTKYKLQYSENGKSFKTYRQKGDTEDTTFYGNSDRSTVVYHDLVPPIRARYIRFRVLAYSGHCSMRVELYGCKETFQCPVCSATGANAESACDQNVKYEVCNRNNAVCQLTKKALESNMQLSVTRKCSDKQTFLDEREKCQRDANCLNTAMCAESFCMAPAPDAFQCAYCKADLGWKAYCIGRVEYKVCTKPKPACFVTQQFKEGEFRISRGCGSEMEYQKAKNTCRESPKTCPLINRCNGSKCVATYPIFCGKLQKRMIRASAWAYSYLLVLWSTFCA